LLTNYEISGLGVAGILVFLAGCSVGPDYHPPKTAAPANWSEQLLGGPTNRPVAFVEWWKTFKDPEMDSLIRRAVLGNYDLKLAEGRLSEERATRSGAVWDFGPTVNLNGSYTKQQISKNTALTSATAPSTTSATSPTPSNPAQAAAAVPTVTEPREARLYDTNFDATWELDLFGAKRRTLEANNANVAASEEDRRDVLVTLLGDVARNYIEVRGYQQRIAITRKNIAAQSEGIALSRDRFKAGLTSELDVKQAEALLATTQATLPSLDTSLKQAVHSLGVLLGEPPGALLAELSHARPIPATPGEVPVGLPSDLLRRRPDVRRAERQLGAAVANIGVQTAELFPKISLTGNGGLQSISVSDWLKPSSGYYSIGPTITWRLLDFGRIRAQIKAANARQEQALATYQKAVLTSFQDVENALVAYANEQTRYSALKASVSANRRALEIATELYSKGPNDFLNVLDSERSVLSAEDQLVDSQRTVAENLVTLYKALGGGWEKL
jgi:NodT family efflux transporter outer membrane factor (OMF) lipoprotein